MARTSTAARIRFVGAERIPTKAGRVRVRVTLEVSSGKLSGTAEAPAGDEGELQAAAEATIDALARVLTAQNARDIHFQIREVGPFDAFGNAGVMVAIRMEHGAAIRSLLGFSPFSDDAARAASLAVLSATNRILALRPRG